MWSLGTRMRTQGFPPAPLFFTSQCTHIFGKIDYPRRLRWWWVVGWGRVAERAITVIFFDSLKKSPQHRSSGGWHWSFQHGHVVLWKLLFSVWLVHQLGQDSNILAPWVGSVGCGKSSALGILPLGFFKCQKVSEVSAGKERLLQTGNWEAWKSKFPRYSPLSGVGCCCWWVHTQLSECQLMSAWPFPLELSAACAEWGSLDDKYQRTGCSLPEGNQTVLSPSFPISLPSRSLPFGSRNF